MLFRPREFVSLQLDSAPATFWDDVFVDRRLPWLGFLQSVGCHVVALAALFTASRILALQPHAAVQPTLAHADVIYYTPFEYLPPLDTRASDPKPTRNADPEYSAQPIISVPPEANNRQQTIVAPPKVQLDRDLAIPNMVALVEQTPNAPLPIAPPPVIRALEITRLAPQMKSSVIAPPPDLQTTSRSALPAPQAGVIAPPPIVDANSTHRLADFSVAASAVIAPAPKLTLDPQQSFSTRSSGLRSPRGASSDVVAPPPSARGIQNSRSAGDVIALSLHPAVGPPPAAPAGNRRGSFAATPEGHHGATGAAGAFGGESAPRNAGTGDGKANGAGLSGKTDSRLPSGLYVGKPSSAAPIAGDPAPKSSNADSVNPNLIAGFRPRVPTRSLQPESKSELSEEERAVFGNRKFYSLTLNMPNLNSVGGSWIIRFAALKAESGLGSPSSRAASASDQASVSDLSAPSAMRKVDPAYPLELMRQNVGGTVILYAVIHADGTVGNVRVLRSVDDRLDQFAREALAKWQFSPATRNGAAVEVEATFRVPFRPGRWQ